MQIHLDCIYFIISHVLKRYENIQHFRVYILVGLVSPQRLAGHQSRWQKPIFQGSDHEMNISAVKAWNSGLTKYVRRRLTINKN